MSSKDSCSHAFESCWISASSSIISTSLNGLLWCNSMIVLWGILQGIAPSLSFNEESLKILGHASMRLPSWFHLSCQNRVLFLFWSSPKIWKSDCGFTLLRVKEKDNKRTRPSTRPRGIILNQKIVLFINSVAKGKENAALAPSLLLHVFVFYLVGVWC